MSASDLDAPAEFLCLPSELRWVLLGYAKATGGVRSMQTDKLMTDQHGPVLTCQKTDCSYNRDECCHAEHIQVGDEHPACDTYTHEQVRIAVDLADVPTCKVSDCYFNESSDCHAVGITVADHRGHADCLTARPR
jgi:hypothetical protein